MPERGYHLELITPVPLPRKPSGDLVRLPLRVRRAVRQTRAVLDDVDADVVVGFGGYVALPAYLAARGGLGRRRRVPVVVHEANASAGWANRVGARSAQRVLSAVPDPGPAPRRGGRRAGAGGDHLAGPGGAAGRGARPLRVRRRRQGAAGVRRLAGRAVDQPGRRGRRQRPCRGRSFGAARARAEEHPRPARARRRRSAVCRRAVPGPDGPGLRRRRPGHLPVRGDDGRRGDRGRPARGVRAAADRQRRAATQRAAGGQRRRRAPRRRRRPDAVVRRRDGRRPAHRRQAGCRR